MTATDCDFKPDKPREYRLFLVWQNMTRPMKILGHEYLDQEGINNPDIRELAGIKTLKELSDYLNVAPNTLTNWKRQPIPQEYQDISWRNWLTEIKPRIVGLVAEGLAKRKDPASAKFLLELEGEYIQQTKVTIDGTQELFEGLRQIADTLNSGSNEQN